MKSYILKQAGSIKNLLLEELPIPELANNEVLIQVRTISINPVDVKTRSGNALYSTLKHFTPLVLGWDISGTIIAKGKLASKFNVGDDVFGMINFIGHGRAYAEYVASPENQLAIKPANISHEEAAAATLSALTAWQALTRHVSIIPGDRILIHAASGGVGHYAVQIARYLGAHVTGTSSAVNKDFVINLGANEHIDYRTQKFEEVENNFDIILETIGGDNFIRSLDVLNKNGIIINLIPDAETQLDTSKVEHSTLEVARQRDLKALYFPVTSNGSDMQHIALLLEKGILKSHISQTYTFNQLPQAHTQIESGRTKGKIVIVL